MVSVKPGQLHVVIDDAQVFNDKLKEWEDFYNYHRPYGGLGGQTPYERLKQRTQARVNPSPSLAQLEQVARTVLQAKSRQATCEPDETSETPTDRKQRDRMRAIRGTLLSSFW